jgi:hypothetical protein
VLLLTLVDGLATLPEDALVVQAVFVLVAVPLPLLTAIFARSRTVTEWVAAEYR